MRLYAPINHSSLPSFRVSVLEVVEEIDCRCKADLSIQTPITMSPYIAPMRSSNMLSPSCHSVQMCKSRWPRTRSKIEELVVGCWFFLATRQTCPTQRPKHQASSVYGNGVLVYLECCRDEASPSAWGCARERWNRLRLTKHTSSYLALCSL